EYAEISTYSRACTACACLAVRRSTVVLSVLILTMLYSGYPEAGALRYSQSFRGVCKRKPGIQRRSRTSQVLRPYRGKPKTRNAPPWRYEGPYSENLPTQGEAVLNRRSASRLNLRETGLGASSSPASRAMCRRDTRSAPIRVVAARAPLACRTAASPPEARRTSGCIRHPRQPRTTLPADRRHRGVCRSWRAQRRR